MRCALTSLAVVSLLASVQGQQAPGAKRGFDVVSIRANTSGDVNVGFQPQPGGRFVWTNQTLGGLIRLSYQRWGFDMRELVGGPDWIDTARFDVIAQTGSNPTTDADGMPRQVFQMIQAMLADRFRLQLHEEMRERPIYELIVARNDERLGPKLRKSSVDCAAVMKETVAGRPPARLPDGRPPCAIGNPPGRMTSAGLTMKEFAAALQGQVNRPIVDRTMLNGPFDWDVEFAPVFQAGRGGQPPPPDATDTDRPSIFTALEEQLGLKLQSTRGPVAVLVIDRAERPTPN